MASASTDDAAAAKFHGLGREAQDHKKYRSAINNYRKCIEKSTDLKGDPAQLAADAQYNIAICKLALRGQGQMKDTAFKSDEMLDLKQAFIRYGQLRLEPIYQIVRFFRVAKDYKEGYAAGIVCKHLLGPPPSGKFIERDVYAYKFADELCIVAYWAGDYPTSLEMGLRVLNGNKYPMHQEDRLWRNAQFAVKKLGVRPRVQVPTAPLDLRTVDIRWINVAAQKERAARTAGLLERLGLAHAVRFNAVTGIAPEKGCPYHKRNYRNIAESHCRVLEETILKTGRPVLILEDDIAVEDEKAVAEQIKNLNIPVGCDSFYLGINTCSLPQYKIVARLMGDGCVRLRNVLSTHAIIYMTPSFARAIVDWARVQIYKNKNTAIDDILAWHFSAREKIYGTPRPLFYQDDPQVPNSERVTRKGLSITRL